MQEDGARQMLKEGKIVSYDQIVNSQGPNVVILVSFPFSKYSFQFFSLVVQVLSTGIVTSPNYPCNFPNNLNVTETITVKEGMVVVLEFTAFNTEADYDKLTIRDGDGTILMEERSGKCRPGKIWSKTNVVHLHFYTDGWDTQTGWNATWAVSTPTGDHFVKTNFI